jgi:hypothetical protein
MAERQFRNSFDEFICNPKNKKGNVMNAVVVPGSIDQDQVLVKIAIDQLLSKSAQACIFYVPYAKDRQRIKDIADKYLIDRIKGDVSSKITENVATEIMNSFQVINMSNPYASRRHNADLVIVSGASEWNEAVAIGPLMMLLQGAQVMFVSDTDWMTTTKPEFVSYITTINING